MARLIIFLYRVLGTVLIWPAALLMSRHPNFRGTIRGRLGFTLPVLPDEGTIVWVHAASVGEVKAARGLIKELKAGRKNLFVCLSSVTVTGRDVATKIPEVDLVIPFPFDLSWVMRRYMLHLHPEALMIVETELWPNMILAAERLGIPVVFVNARMTDRSYTRFEKVRAVIKEVLKNVQVFAMADSDAQRFSGLGAQKVEVLGNLKFDHVSDVDMGKRATMRKQLGVEGRAVFIAGSIREGEETEVMDAIAYAASRIEGLYSIVAPRHPAMLVLLKELADRRNIRWGLRSQMPSDIDLLFVDTFGELFDLYGSADAAFVGGSLKELGGQNILEPVAWGVPTIHGPHMDNFLWAMDVVQDSTLEVADSAQLGEAVVKVISHQDDSRDMAARAREALNAKRGVTKRYVQALGRFIR
ncbi:MAG TPA: 3-deoxy-D-manno-octulosonic acid transferase [Deltaproteobacteria bacterium]|nr:3-deoxy-D-manno-octulosonic acid transferase [Deltaproteobacteria bacterium]HPJ94894.1 3-deoxy-D-manno-octulosonic acid transferase [Deltaproteobacteria bacterium]